MPGLSQAIKATSAIAAGTLLLAAVCSAEARSTPDQQTVVAVTIYNQNLALVKDRRDISLQKGEQVLAFRGVSAQMRPETALLRNTDQSDALQVLEQNFDFDLLTPQKLLEKYLGREVRIARINPATGRESVQNATVLSVQSGTVVRIGDRIETNPPGRFIFDELPANLRDQPTLSVELDSDARGKQSLELSYLTGGLSWKADYVAEISQDDSSLDINGWVTLDNQSGTAYNNAALQLVAGDVNQVAPALEMRKNNGRVAALLDAAPAMAEETLFEYHLYSLARPTTIQDKQKKQVSLLSGSGIKTTKELVLQGQNNYYARRQNQLGQKLKFGVYLQFDNEEKNSLGVPLPKGVVRVYKRDSNGNAQFVGEDRIDHTPNKESVRLKLGNSFDVTANKKQTDFKAQDKTSSNRTFDSSFEIEVHNAKKEVVEVIIREPIPGDWQMLSESGPHTKVSSGMAEWRLQVPALGSKTLSFTTRVKF